MTWVTYNQPHPSKLKRMRHRNSKDTVKQCCSKAMDMRLTGSETNSNMVNFLCTGWRIMVTDNIANYYITKNHLSSHRWHMLHFLSCTMRVYCFNTVCPITKMTTHKDINHELSMSQSHLRMSAMTEHKFHCYLSTC
jgi:hypothetical protein